MYKRDVAVVILSFLALFLCLQHEGSFSFNKALCVGRFLYSWSDLRD
jgi:hypothetical protein